MPAARCLRRGQPFAVDEWRTASQAAEAAERERKRLEEEQMERKKLEEMKSRKKEDEDKAQAQQKADDLKGQLRGMIDKSRKDLCTPDGVATVWTARQKGSKREWGLPHVADEAMFGERLPIKVLAENPRALVPWDEARLSTHDARCRRVLCRPMRVVVLRGRQCPCLQ